MRNRLEPIKKKLSRMSRMWFLLDARFAKERASPTAAIIDSQTARGAQATSPDCVAGPTYRSLPWLWRRWPPTLLADVNVLLLLNVGIDEPFIEVRTRGLECPRVDCSGHRADRIAYVLGISVDIGGSRRRRIRTGRPCTSTPRGTRGGIGSVTLTTAR